MMKILRQANLLEVGDFVEGVNVHYLAQIQSIKIIDQKHDKKLICIVFYIHQLFTPHALYDRSLIVMNFRETDYITIVV